jgi:hypothetical protein
MSRTLSSRRGFFVRAGAVACAAVVPPLISNAARACPGQARVTRKNIDELTGPELATYEHAVRLLREGARSSSGQTLFHPALRQAAMPDSTIAGRPWDRRHLEAIEALLRATDPARTAEITVPYWDFTQPASGREYPAAFERAGSPLFAAAHDGDSGQLDPVFWSYHAYIDTVRGQWERDQVPIARGVTAHLWIGRDAVEIRTSRARTA